jgi:hypothetical protein
MIRKGGKIRGSALIALQQTMTVHNNLYMSHDGFDGLEVAWWPLVPKFVGSNPAEAVGFLRAKKSSTRLSSEEK